MKLVITGTNFPEYALEKKYKIQVSFHFGRMDWTTSFA